MTKTLSLQLPDQLYDTIEKIAHDKNQSKDHIIQDLLENYIQDYIDLKYAKEVIEDIDSNRTKLTSFEDMIKKYDL